VKEYKNTTHKIWRKSGEWA